MMAVTVIVTLWHYPLLQGWLQMPSCGEGDDHSLWVRDDQDGCDGIPATTWDQGYRPGPPRIALQVLSPPSQRNIPTGRPVAASP